MLDQKPMWIPPRDESRSIFKFMKRINDKFQLEIDDYKSLHRWSCDNTSQFWGEVFDFCEIIHSVPYEYVFDEENGVNKLPPRWFPGARLNFAENLLRRNDDKDALIFTGESMDSNEETRVSFKELREMVRQFTAGLRAYGVKKGDKIAALMPNCIECTIAMLASSAIGAIWSSASTDFGALGVLERFKQVQPKILFSVHSVVYNGKVHDNSDNLITITKDLPSLEKVIIVPFVKKTAQTNPSLLLKSINNCIELDDLLSAGRQLDGCYPNLTFEQLPFDHPLFIMFSSGTTGAPKCIVHSAGGTLLKHLCEHILQTCMTDSDVIMFYTTVGWMMWNWLMSSLTTGATVVLYDGSPFMPHKSILFDLIDRFGITIIGMGAKCISICEQYDLHPVNTHKMTSLHTILATGSPLSGSNFDYIYESIKPNLLIGSISGGTDIIACFMGASWACGVSRGECQCLYLGCDMQSWTANRTPIYGERGELVCLKAFPSMPIYFLNDTLDNNKYQNAYFARFEGVWAHGDYCIINKHSGGVIMLGRSDATLNPNGVRFGSAEIYQAIERIPEIVDGVCVSQKIAPGEERVVLFVVMAQGKEFDADIAKSIRATIRKQLSARHVPAVILPIADIPYTVSGKKVEIAVKQIINGETVVNQNALKNPQSLDLYKDLEQLKLD